MKNILFQRVDELFSEFDVNSNNVLDQTELAKLNMYLMMSIPRLGIKHLGNYRTGIMIRFFFLSKRIFRSVRIEYKCDSLDGISELYKNFKMEISFI